MLIVLALIPQWGYFDFASAVDAETGVPMLSRDHPFTGLLALAQLSLIRGSLWLWLVIPAVLCVYLLSRTKIARRVGLRLPQGAGWDFALAGAWLYCSGIWLQVLLISLSGPEQDPLGFHYRDLLFGFWIFPIALLAAVAIQFLPMLLKSPTLRRAYHEHSTRY
jgi:hypothetical protein